MRLKRLTPDHKLSRRVYDELESYILNGKLKAGDRLPTEAELCDKLGVSRTSLREALQQLKGRGLIESTAGRGMFVRAIDTAILQKELSVFAQVADDPNAFFELVDLRLLIEPENARIAARATHKGSRECLAAVEVLIEEMRTNIDNVEAFMEADLDMHLRIAEESNNRFIAIILSAVKPLGKRFGRTNHDASDFIAQTLREHEAIVDAIRRGDARSAHKAMRDHLISSRDHFHKHPLTPSHSSLTL